MRSRSVLFHALALSTLLGASDAHALVGGTLLTSHQERAGIFQIATYDGSVARGGCTATVLYSSVATNRTWLVTAAHCFSYIDSLHYVYGHFATPRAAVIFDLDSDTSGTSESVTSAADSVVHVHPEWRGNGGHTAWFGPRDMAFIRVNTAIPIFDADGVQIPEYRRPIFTGPATEISEPYSSTWKEYYGRNVFCGQSDGNLRCDTLSNLWWSPNFRNTFLQLPAGAWDTGFYAAGDSGGPLIKYAPGLTRQWEGAGSVLDAAMHGAVLGVLQGPTVWCDYIQNGNCNPSDGLATRFEGVGTWLATLPYGSNIPRISSWASFSSKFRYAVGQPTDLVGSEGSYSFPAYAGKIVGFGIHKATNRAYTWYDNGSLTIGTHWDLDLFSQAPPPVSDLVPTQFFSGAPGKSHARIVAMLLSPSGAAYTWYDDGTTYTGTPTDLDAGGAARTFTPAAGKSIEDLVAIAQRPAGGVIAYYRDGTKSEGTATDLDRYAAPTSVDLGSHDPDDILGIDTMANGQTVTLFAHPTM